MIKFIHLSDFHFHGGQSQKNDNHRHSISHLKGIEKIVRKHESTTDRIIIKKLS